MSDFIGSNLYYIVSPLDNELRIDLAGGKKADGTAVAVWNKSADKHNTQWHFVYAGIGKSKKDEYHILNRSSGTYLTAPEDFKSNGICTGNTLSPFSDRVRWNLIPCRNETGRYWISPIKDSKLSLNIKNVSQEDGAQIILYNGPAQASAPNSQWYLRLVDDAILNCPEVGKAPKI